MSNNQQENNKEQTKVISNTELYEFEIGSFFKYFFAEKASFILICTYLIFEYVRPQTAYPTMDILPWAFLTIILAAIFKLAEPKTKERYLRHIDDKNSISVIFSIFILHVLLSSIFASYPVKAFDQIKIILSWFIVYLLIISIVNTERRFLLFLALFFLVNLKMSQHGFTTWVKRGFSFSSWGVGGAPGWFQNSGEFGVQMCIFLPMVSATIYALSDKLNNYKKYLLWFLPITAAGAIIASSSRGAVLALIAMTLFFAFIGGKFIRKLFYVAILATTAYLLMPPEFKERFSTAGQDDTSLSRLTYWENGMKMANENPILGVGYYNWQHYYRENYFDSDIYRRVEEAHNTFVQAAAELGYVGLSLLLLMCWYSVKINRDTVRISTKLNNKLFTYLPKSFNIALIGMFVGTFFISALYYPFYWIHFALCVSCNRAVKELAYRTN